MAQTGNFSPIQLYSSSTPGNTPAVGNLVNNTIGSELAINIADGKLFYKDSSNAIQVIGWKTTPTTAGGTGLTSYTAGDMVYWASGTTFTKLGIGTANYIMTSSGTAPQWSASIGPAQGGTGITSYAVGDLIYASGTTTLSKLADVATGNALISGGVGVAPSWGKIGLTTHVSGTLQVGNGGTGLTAVTAGYIPFGSSSTALSTSSNLFWDAANNSLGISTTTPSAPLQINGNRSAYGYGEVSAVLLGANGVYNPGLAFVSANTNYRYVQAFDVSNGAFIWKNSTDGTNYSERLRFFASGGVSIGNTADPGTGKLLVNSGILVNTTSAVAAATVSVLGDVAIGFSASKYRRIYYFNGDDNLYFYNGTNQGYLSSAGAWTNASDAKLKNSIVDIKYGLDAVLTTQPRSYKMNGLEGNYIGFVAQELQKVIPEVVSGNPEIQLGVDYGSLVAVAFKAIQELNEKIDSLKAQLGAK